MSVPGWYPDPGGSGQFRFWDGANSSATTSPTPGATPSSGRPGDGRRGGRGLIALLLVTVLVVVGGVALVVLRPWSRPTDITDNPPTPTVTGGGDGPVSPTPSASQPTPDESDSPGASDTATAGPPQQCPPGNPSQRSSTNTADRLVGGGLSIEPPAGWTIVDGGVPLGYDVAMAQAYIDLTWVNQVAVGALLKDEGFPEPKAAAEYLMQCASTATWYPNLEKVTIQSAQEVTISGRPGYEIVAEIVSPYNDEIRGDVLRVVVVDVGAADSLGMYIGTSTIDNVEVRQLEEAARATLAVA